MEYLKCVAPNQEFWDIDELYPITKHNGEDCIPCNLFPSCLHPIKDLLGDKPGLFELVSSSKLKTSFTKRKLNLRG